MQEVHEGWCTVADLVDRRRQPNIRPRTGTPATSFNEREMQICTVARMVEDAKTYCVADVARTEWKGARS